MSVIQSSPRSLVAPSGAAEPAQRTQVALSRANAASNSTENSGAGTSAQFVRVDRFIRNTISDQVILRDAHGRAQTLDLAALSDAERRLARSALSRNLSLLLVTHSQSSPPRHQLLLPPGQQPLAGSTPPTLLTRDVLQAALLALQSSSTLLAVRRPGPSLAQSLSEVLMSSATGAASALMQPTPRSMLASDVGRALSAALDQALHRLRSATLSADQLVTTSRSNGLAQSIESAGIHYEARLLDQLLRLARAPAQGATLQGIAGGSTGSIATQSVEALTRLLGQDLKSLLLQAAARIRDLQDVMDKGSTQYTADAKLARLGDMTQQALLAVIRSQLAHINETAQSTASVRPASEAMGPRDGSDTQSMRGSVPFWWGARDDADTTIEQLDWRLRRRSRADNEERLSFRMAGEWPGIGGFVAQIERCSPSARPSSRDQMSGAPVTATPPSENICDDGATSLTARCAADHKNSIPSSTTESTDKDVQTTRPTQVSDERAFSSVFFPDASQGIWKISITIENVDAIDRLKAGLPELISRLTQAGFNLTPPRLSHDPQLVERLAKDCRECPPWAGEEPLAPERLHVKV